MAYNDTQVYLAWAICLVLGAFILFWYLDLKCRRCRSSLKDVIPNRVGYTPRENYTLPPVISTKSNDLIYKMYDSQDYYQRQPYIYPTPNSYQTSLYKIKRMEQSKGISS